MRLHIFFQPGTQPYWEAVSGKLLDSFPPPAVWAITDIQERSTGPHKSMRSDITYMHWKGQRIDTNTHKVEHKQHTKKLTTHAHPWTCQAGTIILPFPNIVPTWAWQDPSRSKLLTHSCTCCLPADRCSSIVVREHAHTGFHSCEVAECRTAAISLLCTVVPLPSDKCNSNSGSPFYLINKTYLCWVRGIERQTGN